MSNLNYGVVGNCRTAALISEKGSIDWLCFPDFDSPSIFASLLDRERGGSFGFDVTEDYHISQSYVPHTNILSTSFSSKEGEFVVLDYMPYYRSCENAHYLPAELYRYVRWIKGKPRFKVNYVPAPNYAQGKVIHNVTSEFIESYCSSDNKDCIPLTDGVQCGNCARHCPTGAIQMVPSIPEDKDSPKIPVINVERCIGCGACENLCPARPFSAIYVEGHERHRII